LKTKEKNKKIKFGCYIYQDSLEYEDILRIALECEKLGYDSIWLKDNFIPWIQDYITFNVNLDSSINNNNNNNNSQFNEQQEKHQDRDQKKKFNEEQAGRMMLECWTTLSSLALVTTKIRLGAILVNLYRNPAIVAKMASTLDSISNGRLDIGLSAGWYKREAEAYGIGFPEGSIRTGMLEESVMILRQMLRTENKNENNGKISFRGRHYCISDAECNPKPVQKPSIPIWIGGSGKKTLKVVAKYADGWNYGLCNYNEYAEKLSLLENYCHDSNNDNNNDNESKACGYKNYDDIVKAWHGILFLGKDENELRTRTTNMSYNRGIVKDSNLIISGTPKTILRELKRYLNIGVTYFTVCFADFPDTRSLELFAEHIMHTKALND
jgi:alkanesulfonate monooxygenase SsuD/methylene tetrahydromethanopterin reductase-like flavin-dependent oxidoreductase (luciferase family)